MAKIWPVYEGRRATSGEQWADVPVSDAVSLFALKPTHFLTPLAITPRFADTNLDLTWAGYKHIVVEIEEQEANKNWKPGFYRSPVKPAEAFKRLLHHTLANVLGDANVVRVETRQALDSMGGDTLRITVVVTPAALKQIANETVLAASVALQNQLRELRADRSSVSIDYATEAELAQNAGT
jgi:hypothetical protein